MSKEEIKNLLIDFVCEYDFTNWNNDKVYEKFSDLIYKQIFDLEAKLAESELETARWQEHFEQARLDYDCLKEELAEKEKENNELVFIIEEIEQFAWEQLNNENFDKYKAYDEMLTKIKQLTTQSPYERQPQDKISFAVEQLIETKEFADKQFNLDTCNLALARVLDKIDNQIKQLKEKKW